MKEHTNPRPTKKKLHPLNTFFAEPAQNSGLFAPPARGAKNGQKKGVFRAFFGRYLGKTLS
jgi:hypothetical protein